VPAFLPPLREYGDLPQIENGERLAGGVGNRLGYLIDKASIMRDDVDEIKSTFWSERNIDKDFYYYDVPF